MIGLPTRHFGVSAVILGAITTLLTGYTVHPTVQTHYRRRTQSASAGPYANPELGSHRTARTASY